MSSRKMNVVFVLLIIVAIFAVVIIDANRYSDTEPSLDYLKKEALAYYVDKYGDSDVTINAIDYDCHVELEVIKDGNVVMTLEYSNGELFEVL